MTYEDWLNENDYVEDFTTTDALLIYKKNGEPAWKDNEGHSFKALSNKLTWEAGHDIGCEEGKNDFARVNLSTEYNINSTPGSVLFALCESDINNLISSIDIHKCDQQLLNRLNAAMDAIKEFKKCQEESEF